MITILGFYMIYVDCMCIPVYGSFAHQYINGADISANLTPFATCAMVKEEQPGILRP
jgi:hypothetical protein